jgi:predicted permease
VEWVATFSGLRILLPFLIFAIASVLGIVQMKVASKFLNDGSANIIPLCVGSGNNGYFGVPVALLLFGQEGLGLYIMCMLGTTLFENSVGFYLAARGQFGIKDALFRVLRLPAVYAFIAAMAMNLSGVDIPEIFVPLFDNFRGVRIPANVTGHSGDRDRFAHGHHAGVSFVL